MATPISLSINQPNVIVVRGESYFLTLPSGKALTKFKAKIINGKLYIYVEPSEDPVLVIENYQEANFIIPSDAKVSGDAASLFLVEESSNWGWWIGGGLALATATAVAVGSSSKGSSSSDTPAPSIVPPPQNTNEQLAPSPQSELLTKIDEAIKAAEKVLSNYQIANNNALGNNTLSPNEADDLNKLADKVKQAKEVAQSLINELDGNAAETVKQEKQITLNTIVVPNKVTFNDSDNDGITDSAEAQAKQTLDISFAKLHEKITAYTQVKNSVGKAISQAEAEQLNSLVQAIATEKTAVQRLIDGLQTTLGQTKDDITYTQEKQTALNQISVPAIVVANDDDNDDISNTIETAAKQTLETAISAAKTKLQAYNTAKTNAGATISPDEAQAINRLAGEVTVAKQQAQRLIDNLPNTIGTTQGDVAYAAQKQNELNAIGTSTATANDSDNDGITDSAEEQAKQALETAISAAKTKLQTYNTTKANAGTTISPDEAQTINRLAGEVATTKQTAQDLINNLPNTIGTTQGDVAYTAQKQNELNAITADKVIAKPTVQITAIADDGVVTHDEQSNTANIVVNVGNVGADYTATLSLYDGTRQIINNQAVRNGNNTLTVQGTNLTSKTLKAVVTVSNDGLTARSDETTKTYTIDTQTNPITTSLVSVAGVEIVNDKTNEVIANRHLNKDAIPVVVKVAGLETGGQVTVSVNVGAKNFKQTTTQNGEVTILVDKNALIAANSLTVQASAQDK